MRSLLGKTFDMGWFGSVLSEIGIFYTVFNIGCNPVGLIYFRLISYYSFEPELFRLNAFKPATKIK